MWATSSPISTMPAGAWRGSDSGLRRQRADQRRRRRAAPVGYVEPDRPPCRGYLEVLAATHDTPLAEELVAALARYEGLHLVALSHADIPAERERLEAAGFAMQPVVRLRRRDKTLAGAPEVAWSVPARSPAPCRKAASNSPRATILTASGRPTRSCTPTPWTPSPISCSASPTGEVSAPPVTRTERAEANDVSSVTLDRSRLLFAEPDQAISLLGADPPSLPWIAGQRCAARTSPRPAARWRPAA